MIKQVHEQHADVDIKAIQSFVDSHYNVDVGRRHLTSEEVQNVKELISRVGTEEAVLAGLEFLNDSEGYPVAYEIWKALEERRGGTA